MFDLLKFIVRLASFVLIVVPSYLFIVSIGETFTIKFANTERGENFLAWVGKLNFFVWNGKWPREQEI